MSIFSSEKKKENSEIVSAFENEINNAFSLLKQSGVGRLVIAARQITKEEYADAKERNPDSFSGWVSTDKKIYYPSELYLHEEIGLINHDKSYKLITIVSGDYSKERITSPVNTEEIKGNGKTGFEIVQRYFVGDGLMNLIGNHNQKYITMNDFEHKYPETIRAIADILANSNLSPESINKRVQDEIEFYKNKSVVAKK